MGKDRHWILACEGIMKINVDAVVSKNITVFAIAVVGVRQGCFLEPR